MSTIPVGSTVRHRRLGAGTVLQSRYRGYEYWVQFKHLRLWVKGTELTFDGPRVSFAKNAVLSNRMPVTDRRVRPAPKPSPEAKAPYVPCHADRSVLEAFRMGIVPDKYVEPWTFGRDDELSHLRHWLDDAADGSLLLEGAYGSGKSHLLQMLRVRGAEDGWVVSYSNLDVGEESAAFPKRLYRQIARGLHAPGIGGLNQILLQAVEKAGGNPIPDHPILGPVLDRVVANKVKLDDWHAIAGQGAATAATGYLPDFTTCANVYCNLLSGLGWLVTEVLGFKGLLLLVDEVETASACLYRFHWRRAQSFFRGLTMTANDDPELLEETIIRGKQAYQGDTTGLIYAGHRRIPYLYNVPCGLKVVLATTPGPMRGEYARWRGEQSVIELEPVRPRALRELAERIHTVYEGIHGVGFSNTTVTALCGKLMERFGTVATRTFIKAFVEVLDFRRFHRDKPLMDLF